MDTSTFSNSLTAEAVKFVGNYFYLKDMPRVRVINIIDDISQFLLNHTTSSFFEQIIKRMEILGEDPGTLQAYKTMIYKLQRPFEEVNTEWKYAEYMKKVDTYFEPNEIEIDVKSQLVGTQTGTVEKSKKISIQSTSLRRVLKNVFELPQMFEKTMEYCENLEKKQNTVTNIIQAESWQKQKK